MLDKNLLYCTRPELREEIYRLRQLNIMDTSKILTEKKLNSSVVSAGLCIGVHPRVLEYYLPMLLDATKTINEEIKTQRNREGILKSVLPTENA